MNLKKDVGRGAANCDVLQEGRSESDSAHVTTTSPIRLKARELQEVADAKNVGIDPKREKSTSWKREDKDVKPL